MGKVVWVKDPFNPLKGLETFAVERPITVRAFLDARGIGDFPLPTICLHNGRPALRREWIDLEIGPADVVTFRAYPHGGGGGGGGGKAIISTVAMIAVMVLAPEIGALLAPEIGSFFAAELGIGLTMEMATAIGAGLFIGGAMLVTSALFSAPKPSMPSMSWGGFGTPPAPSPTYGLNASGNQARLGQVIPEIFGRHKAVFDLAADPYQEYVDNEQILCQLHCIGVGEYDVERLLIEDTPISSFEEVEFEIIPPGGALTLFDPVVVTAPEVAGQESKGPNQLADGEDGWLGPFVASDPATKATAIGIDTVFSRGLYCANNDGTLAARSVDWVVEVRAIDDNGDPLAPAHLAGYPQSKATGRLLFTVNPSAGDTATLNGVVWTFVAGAAGANQVTIGADAAATVTAFAAALNASANPALTVATYVAVGKGLVIEYDTAGLVGEAFTLAASRAIASGETLTGGGFARIATETHSAADNSQIRLSHKYTLSAERYEVRIKRANDNTQDSRAGHESRWSQLRAYLDEEPNYGDVTLVAVKMRATDNLSQRSSRLINGVVTRKLPIYDAGAGTWSAPVATRSIAAAASYILRAENGANLSDNRNDLAALWTLHATWEARGDTFNGIFDSPLTAWEALSRVLKVGRGAPYQQGGWVRYMRDQPQALPSALFNRRNIVRGSFSIEYIMPSDDTADAVTVEYFNEATWKIAEVTVALRDGVIRELTPAELRDSPPSKPARVQYFGITVKAQAVREACFVCACNIWRRRMPGWRTELDAMVLSYGDVVAISHPLPSWGQDGEIEAVEGAWDEVGAVLTLSEPVRWGDAASLFLALRRRDGKLASPAVEVEPAPGGDPNKVVALDPLPIEPDTGGDRERTYYALGAADEWAKRVRVRSLRPRKNQVEILAVVEDERVHVN